MKLNPIDNTRRDFTHGTLKNNYIVRAILAHDSYTTLNEFKSHLHTAASCQYK